MSEAAPIPAELRALADKTASGTQQRMAKMEWQGRRVWLKKAVPPKATHWTRLQGFVSFIMPLSILRPTSSPGGAEGLRIEAWRIGEFRRAGFPAPEVLAMTDGWLVLEDLGDMVERKLQKDTSLSPDAITDIICDCAEAVAKLHKAGLAHGRAKLNDMTLMKDGTIGFIDFEEDIDAGGIPPHALKARDLWLFLCTVAHFEKQCPGIIEEAYESYLEIYRDEKVLRALKKLLRLFSPLRYILWPFHKALGNDFERAYAATTTLIRYKKPVT